MLIWVPTQGHMCATLVFEQKKCDRNQKCQVTTTLCPCKAGQKLDCNDTSFGKALSKAQIMSKHTIGVLKGHFPWLRSICKQITEDPESFGSALLFTGATVVLHNILTKEGLDDKLDEHKDDTSLPDNRKRTPGADESMQEACNSNVGNPRRTQPLHHSLERHTLNA